MNITEIMDFGKVMARSQAKGRKRRTAKLDETRQLKRPASDYLTDLEGSNCETLEDWDINHMPFKWQGVDLDRFKRECGEIDND